MLIMVVRIMMTMSPRAVSRSNSYLDTDKADDNVRIGLIRKRMTESLRAVFHSNSYLDNDNADDNVRIGITGNDDDVSQGCVSQQLTPSLSTSPHPASSTKVNKDQNFNQI